MTRIGVLTGGGDTPGLNAAIRAIGRTALLNGDSVVGVRNGWAGLAGEAPDAVELDQASLGGILPIGGTILGSSRTNPMKQDGGLERVRRNLDATGIDSLVVIGGDDTLSVAAWLAENGSRVVGTPKTMDNDLSVTEYCIGFDSAVAIVSEALDRLHTTAASHHRAMVVEVMGRDTGWVAVEAGLAGGADLILIPEHPVSLEEVLSRVERRRQAGRRATIIVVAEGVRMEGMPGDDEAEASRDAFGHVRLAKRGIADWLAEEIDRSTGLEARPTVLGYTQRGGSPSAHDRIWATRVGAAAYRLASEGASAVMPVVVGQTVRTAPIAEVIAEQRRVPRELYELAATFF